jgi:predicted metal-binding membrane protein
LPRRDLWAILLGLGCITAGAWIYVIVEAGRMSVGMTDGSMVDAMQPIVHLRTWTATEFGLRLLMWVVMMVAMMLPTAAPMTLVYAAVARKAAKGRQPVPPTFVFVAGYLTVWGIFSVAATVAQKSLEQSALLSPTMESASPVLGSSLLVAAGAYELTSYKRACLAHCRAPAHFISQHWRSGFSGAFRLGLALGAYCVGCCWILMGLLFVGGVMNLLWIAVIAAFILLEKTVPFGHTGGRLVGAAMVLAGLVSLTGLAEIA